MRIVCGNGVPLVFLNNMYPFICLEVTISKGTVATEEYITAKLLSTHIRVGNSNRLGLVKLIGVIFMRTLRIQCKDAGYCRLC